MNYLPRDICYLIFSVLIVCLGACSSLSDSEDAVWLRGVWELTYNPDKDDSDKLVFRDDGTVTVQTEKGEEINGKYLINDKQLIMALAMNGKVIDIVFAISEDKAKLIYETGAFYTKKQ